MILSCSLPAMNAKEWAERVQEKCRDRSGCRSRTAPGWWPSRKEGSRQHLPASYMEHDVHGMEYSCGPAWVSCPGSVPPWCCLAPAAGLLENPSSPWHQPRYQ